MAGARYIEFVEAGAQNGPPKDVYAQIERDLGAVPDAVKLHSPVPRVLTGVWCALRESTLAGAAPRAAKEAAALAVAQAMRAGALADFHAGALAAEGQGKSADAVRKGAFDAVPDARAREAARWASACRPPLPSADGPEIAGAAVVAQHLSRMTLVFLGPSASAAGLLKGVLGRFGKAPAAAPGAKAPGESLRFLPEAELPAEFAWASANANVAGALSRLNAVVEEQGKRSLPENLRACLATRLARWNGEALSQADIEDAMKDLQPPEAKLAARFLLLTAFAPELVSEQTVKDFRSRFLVDGGDADRRLVGAAAWASWQAAKRIGSRLAPA